VDNIVQIGTIGRMKRWVGIVTVVVLPFFASTSCKYQNCAALNGVFPHGVGRPGAVDKVAKSTPRVTNFAVDAAQYNENASRLDRDKDGIACERL
jgi:hypothetical protein